MLVQYLFGIGNGDVQKIRWFLLILAIIVALAAALQNNDLVEVQLFFFSRSLPLSVILLSTTAVGFLAGALTTVLMLRRHKTSEKTKANRKSATPADSPAPATKTV